MCRLWAPSFAAECEMGMPEPSHEKQLVVSFLSLFLQSQTSQVFAQSMLETNLVRAELVESGRNSELGISIQQKVSCICAKQ